ncbi:MAG: IS21 family transposase [Gammaproteobacteria bacterium]|nr:IS21 family transposase [Gammaproteobacteria bacterium]
MIDLDTRTAILRLRHESHGIKTIARALAISKNTVKRVLSEPSAPPAARSLSLEPHTALVRELFARCQGNRVRVHEELAHAGVAVPYPTLTRFLRRVGIGVTPKERAGQYHFAPGQEMQHDTSPHTVTIAGTARKLQCASLVLCYSRMLYAQCFVPFHRFYAKIFLTEALAYFQGSASRCMLDNSNIIIVHGTGKNAVPAPEMEAFAARFGFVFVAHEIGDANRSGRVERPFHFIEHNFYPGRSFASRADLNTQLRAWCEQKNHAYKRHLRAVPAELFAAERPQLRPLPIFIPEPYQTHWRTVDLEGYVHLHTNRYSAPDVAIGRSVQVRETHTRVRVFAGHRLLCEHPREEEGARLRKTLPAHRHPGRASKSGTLPALPEEATLRASAPEFAALVEQLRTRHAGRAVRPIRRLHRLFLDYPTEPLRQVVAEALRYGLTDLERIERMLLRTLSGDFFRLPPTEPETIDPTDSPEEDDNDR